MAINQEVFPIEAHVGLIVGIVSSLVLGAVAIVVVICLVRQKKYLKISEEINANEEPLSHRNGGLHNIG